MGTKAILDKEELNQLAKAMNKTAKSADKLAENTNKVSDAYEKLPETVKTTEKELDKVGDEGKEAGDKISKGAENGENSYKKLTSFLKKTTFAALIGAAKHLTSTLEKAVNPQAEYIESLNFLDQAYNNASESGLRLLDTLEKNVGYDPAGLTQQLAMFRQIGNALQIDDKAASMLAENLLKLSVDVKSITGQSLDTVTSKFTSAMAGNTRAVRAYGIDVTQAGLQQQALALGIEKQVSEMSRAEKAILTYITMQRQMSSANGDLARTVNSVANQYEIFKSQISETGRLLGGFLIPVMKAVLPLINGVIMAINVLLSSVLSLFGIDATSLSQEFGTVTADIEDVADGFDDIGTSATNAGKAAKEAQKSLRGFDKLNVIKTPTSSGGSGGSVSGGGGGVGGLGAIDSSLLDKLSEYDLHLDEIKNKAADIRDRIMEWLGFTKIIDPITGDISWKFDHITGGTVLGALAAGGIIYKGIMAIYGVLKKVGILKFLGIEKIIELVKENGFLGTLSKVIPALKSGLGKAGIAGAIIYVTTVLVKAYNEVDKFREKVNDAFSAIGKIIEAPFKILENLLSMIDIQIEDVLGFALNLGNSAIIMVASDLADVITTIGNQIESLLNLDIGGFFGAFANLFDNLRQNAVDFINSALGIKEVPNNMSLALKRTSSELETFTKEFNDRMDSIQQKYQQQYNQAGVNDKYVKELEKIVDANGRVQKGYETKAQFIMGELQKAYGIELKMTDGVIENYQEQLSLIKEQIEKQKQKIIQQLAEEKYVEALKQEKTLENQKNDAYAKRITIEQTMKEITDKNSDAYKELEKQLKEAQQQEKIATENYNKGQQAIINYTKYGSAIIEENADAIEEYTNKILQSYSDEEEGNVSVVRTAYWAFQQRVSDANKSYAEMSEAEKEYANEVLQSIVDLADDSIRETGKLSDDMVHDWREMGEESADALMAALGMLPEDVRQQVVNQMYPNGVGMSEELQRGINANFPSIKITPQLEQPSYENLSWFGRTLSKSISAWLNITPTLKASGGLYSSGIWRPMKAYANGGFPSMGEIFVARETGSPELVGKIGNSTAVMNNDQILDQMTIAVARGMSAVEKESPVIVAKGDTEGLLNFIQFEQISKNRQFGL